MSEHYYKVTVIGNDRRLKLVYHVMATCADDALDKRSIPLPGVGRALLERPREPEYKASVHSWSSTRAMIYPKGHEEYRFLVPHGLGTVDQYDFEKGMYK